ncbi:MAG: hypothetical protein JWP01_3977 [Myxococcales bacterium]|nr:hypothetical protein [Myxococcales bacterium]
MKIRVACCLPLILLFACLPKQTFLVRHDTFSTAAMRKDLAGIRLPVRSQNTDNTYYERRLEQVRSSSRLQRYKCALGSELVDCRGDGGVFIFQAPYPRLFATSQLVDPYRWQLLYDWVPLHLIRGGRKLLDDWRTLANAGGVVMCTQWNCQTFVGVSGVDSETLAMCSLSRDEVEDGLPGYCETVARREGTTWKLRIAVGITSAPQRVEGEPDFVVSVSGVVTPESIYSAISIALVSRPLGEIVRRIDEDILGTRRGLVSDVLSTGLQYWFERVTVRVGVRKNYLGVYGLTVSSTIYVNRQNTDAPSDWRLPQPEQQEAYNQAILASLRSAIDKMCRGTWSDARTRKCQ